jgi:hypothetical protein
MINLKQTDNEHIHYFGNLMNPPRVIIKIKSILY